MVKKIAFFIIASCIGLSLTGQGLPVNFVNWEKKITDNVKTELIKWMKKDEFETTAEYQERIKQKEIKTQELINEITESYEQYYLKTVDWSKLAISEYDADNESFKLILDSTKKNLTFILPIEKGNNSAKNFKMAVKAKRVSFFDIHCVLQNNIWLLSTARVSVNDEFKNASVEYTYDIKNTVGYSPSKTFLINPSDIDIDFSTTTTNATITMASTPFIAEEQNLDPEINIEQIPPYKSKDNPNAIALIIGNSSYKNVSKVEYAVRDARLYKKYLQEVYGVAEKNIMYLENAGLKEFTTALGTDIENSGDFFKMIKSNSDVYVFFSGHGAIGLNDKNSYLMCTEANLTNIEGFGFSVQMLLDKLSKKEAAAKTVILDACFSNPAFVNASGFIAKPNPSSLNDPSMLVLFASKEYASWYKAKKHGLLTYFILKALWDLPNSDTNKDKMLSFAELQAYIQNKDNGIPYYSNRLNGYIQTPTIMGQNLNRNFFAY